MCHCLRKGRWIWRCPLTDRWDRHRTVMATQAAAMLQALVLMGVTVTGWITIFEVVLLNLVLGVVNTLDMPARQSFLIEMVEGREELANAIALNSSMFNAARLVGPAVAGFLLGIVGEWPCFLLNGLSYLAVLASLAIMEVKPATRPTRSTGIVEGLREALVYVWGSPPIRTILALLGLVSMATMPLTVLLPVVATEELYGGADTVGLLTAATGVGALAASLFLAARPSVLGLGRWIAVSTAILGLGMGVLSVCHNCWLWAGVLVIVGFAMVAQAAASNTILQTIVEEDKRGRVMSLYAMAFTGMAPLGSLLSGCLAARIGTMATVLVGGVSCMAGAVVFACLLPGLRKVIRPIYVRAGILPETTLEPKSEGVEPVPAEENRMDIPLTYPLTERAGRKRTAA